MADFEIDAFFNEYLPAGGTETNAVVTVRASGTGPAGAGSGRTGRSAHGRAEVIIIDISGSMEGDRLHEAKAATVAAIDCLPDGVRFGVVAGNHGAEMAYPRMPGLALASDSTRTAAREAVARLEANGGTAIGTWIDLATGLLRDEPGIAHAILLTDGRNEHEEPATLDGFLARAEGVFQCDCRGVGADWEVAELRKIATALLGSYDIVAEPAGLAEDFARMVVTSLGRQVPEVALRVWSPQGAKVELLKQMEPQVDLTGSRLESGPLAGDYPTGPWGDESRDYHLTVALSPGKVGEKILAARITLLVGGEPTGRCEVTTKWTDDPARSTRINRKVAEVMGEAELADVIQEGIDAWRERDIATATDRFGRAVRLASESGNDEAMARLAAMVEIEDAPTGRVRPKAVVEDKDVMILETRSSRMTRSRHD
jgi:hypothetical protein